MRTIYKLIKFPEDGKNHDHAIEWWYFNGHLKDVSGNRYAFMDCLFKVNIKKIGIPFAAGAPFKNFYFAHSVISDLEKKKKYPDIKNAIIVSEDSFTKPLLFINYADPIIINGYDNYIIEEKKPFDFYIENGSISLNLKSTKKPLLESGKGFTNVLGNKSFYYSLTNLKTFGTIKVNGKNVKVSGKAWMDHQWTNSTAYYNDRWNWFSIQFDNNIEIVCCEFISGDKRAYWADVMDKNGKQKSYFKLKFTPSKIWKSKKTGESYPLSWEIEIPEADMVINANALIKDQEMKAGAAKYWEGPIEANGKIAGKKVKGRGFMELVNHASPYGNYSFEELEKSIMRRLGFISR